MSKIVLFGAGGHAKVVLDALVRQGMEVAGLIDDAAHEGSIPVLGRPVLGDRTTLADLRGEFRVALAIGDNRARSTVLAWLNDEGFDLASAIHPAATLGADVIVGGGSFIAAGAVINPDTRLGEGAIVNTAASVDHDCVIGRTVHIAPGARLCGGVTVGDETLVGTGAILTPGIKVGAGVVIGAGSVVIRDLQDGARVAGNPARPLRS